MNNFNKYRKYKPERTYPIDRKLEKNLLTSLATHSGRNNTGRISVRYKWRGTKKLYRKLNFQKDFLMNTYGFVVRLNHDPYRNSFVSLICHYKKIYISSSHYVFKKFYSYTLASEKLRPGDRVVYSREQVDLKPNNVTLLLNVPKRVFFFNAEFQPKKGLKLARSAGAKCKLIKKYKYFSEIQIPSKKNIFVSNQCLVTIGISGNVDKRFQKKWKASHSFYQGIRPKVRGVAKNPIDHPHGGGEGKSSGGKPGGISPWGKLTKGVKTLSKTKSKSNTQKLNKIKRYIKNYAI